MEMDNEKYEALIYRLDEILRLVQPTSRDKGAFMLNRVLRGMNNNEKMTCPGCGVGIIKHFKGRFGEFLGCDNYKATNCQWKINLGSEIFEKRK